MTFRWEPQGDGFGFWAKAGRRTIGMVCQRGPGGSCFWVINDVTASQHQPVTGGEVATLAQGKRSLRRAWLTWLSERGLTEAEPPRTRRRTA